MITLFDFETIPLSEPNSVALVGLMMMMLPDEKEDFYESIGLIENILLGCENGTQKPRPSQERTVFARVGTVSV